MTPFDEFAGSQDVPARFVYSPLLRVLAVTRLWDDHTVTGLHQRFIGTSRACAWNGDGTTAPPFPCALSHERCVTVMSALVTSRLFCCELHATPLDVTDSAFSRAHFSGVQQSGHKAEYRDAPDNPSIT